MTTTKGRVTRSAREAWVSENQGAGGGLCACGCGGEIVVKPSQYPKIPSYLWGHARRGKFKPRPERLPCECGCGLQAQPGKRFISGHNRRGENHTEETKLRLAETKMGELNPQFGKSAPNRGPDPRPCLCGCGQLPKRGREYLSGHNTRGAWMSNRRGWYTDAAGYIRIFAEDHPFAAQKYVPEHRLVVERFLRDGEPDSQHLIRLGTQLYLDPEVVVHHRDGDKANNLIENLEVMTRDAHTQLHHGQGDIRG